MDCAGNASASRGADQLSGKFVGAARVDDRGVCGMQALKDILRGGEQFPAGLHLEIASFSDGGLLGHGQSGRPPRIETAVEDMNVLMTEEFEEPEEPCGSHAGNVVVDDDGAIGVDTLGLDQVLDDPQEGVQSLRPRVDQADSENIEAPGARYMPVGVSFRRTEIHQGQPGISEVTLELFRRP